jgi:hypothetical protein
MKIHPLLLLGSLLLGLTASAAPLIQPNDHIAFCGDAMTEGNYTAFLEKYFIACQPSLAAGLDMRQFGWSAESPDAFLAKLDKDLLPYKPTVVTILYNVADNPSPADPTMLDARRDAETKLIDALKKAGVRTIVLGSPPCVDSTLYHHDPAQATAVNAKLAQVAAVDKDVAAKEGIPYADVFGITSDVMAKIKVKSGPNYSFAAEGMRQPQFLCNVATAYAFLKVMNLNGELGTFTIQFTPDNIIANVSVTGDPKVVTPEKLTRDNTPGPNEFNALCTRYTFCCPGSPAPDEIIATMPFYDDLSSLKLVAKDLPPLTTDVRIFWNENSSWHDYTAAEVKNGVQLPGNMHWPFGGKFEEMNRDINDLLQADSKAGRSNAAGTPDPAAEADHAARLAKAKSWVTPIEYFMRAFPLVAADPPLPHPNIIFDTDMASDVDDVGALALVNDFMCQGECKLIAVCTNVRNGDSGATAKAINTYYGHPDVPIGTFQGEGAKMNSTLDPVPAGVGYHGPGRQDGSHYTVAIHKQFCPDFPTDDKLPTGIDLYRQVLAAAPDDSVVIVSVGLMQNFQDLVQSQPDSVSPLNGLDLVKKKVHELVIMANTSPEDGYFLAKWPTKIRWTTDAGSYVGTGQSLINTPENNPVRVAYGLFGDPEHNALKDSRASWDLTASWLAVRGVGDFWAVLPGRQQYINDITKTPFVGHPNESTITFKMRNEDVAKAMNAELARLPK